MKLAIRNNTLKHRFEVDVSARTAFLNYRVSENVITFTHTEVPSSLNGRGIGTALARVALEYAIEHGLRVIPQCSFVADFVRTHPQYQAALAITIEIPGPTQ
ncbi:N-acetyltransferase [Alloacidobacterium dinghuense]|uniref:N-acetyltransferase n=1 Tax=Alloacidobacterium dinghuense TaxID=2763107 RepID=A0A7G8BH70_9BACT|nr:GNAT family N-acetyltransferase [Alloacidobacterium dinghuense]QNI31890.1 N-acetyltransferase [Alloacidobacterium dinghuense]